MTPSSEFFVGPAVVVDDKIDQPEGGMTEILDQISSAGMPIVKKRDLPEDSEVEHWDGFALIVLDWELNPVDPDVAGIAVPEGLSGANADRVSEFVKRLLTELYCPIFILTNENVDAIRGELARRLQVEDVQIGTRVFVHSKAGVAGDLFGILAGWIRDHPAVYAYKRWELGYKKARRQMFADFELGSTQWPRILWATSKLDGINPHFELSEVISRNILHRFEPLTFEEEVLGVQADESRSQTALRSVIHRSAVVDQASLHDDVIMPGDFFRSGDDDSTILINVTPACDLVARSGIELEDVEMTLLEGTLVPENETGSKTKREKLRNPDGSEVIWVLRTDGRPYRITFKSWRSAPWGVHKDQRIGRLLEPYITLLQQRFALHIHRQGLPRLPESFFG